MHNEKGINTNEALMKCELFCGKPTARPMNEDDEYYLKIYKDNRPCGIACTHMNKDLYPHPAALLKSC